MTARPRPPIKVTTGATVLKKIRPQRPTLVVKPAKNKRPCKTKRCQKRRTTTVSPTAVTTKTVITTKRPASKGTTAVAVTTARPTVTTPKMSAEDMSRIAILKQKFSRKRRIEQSRNQQAQTPAPNVQQAVPVQHRQRQSQDYDDYDNHQGYGSQQSQQQYGAQSYGAVQPQLSAVEKIAPISVIQSIITASTTAAQLQKERDQLHEEKMERLRQTKAAEKVEKDETVNDDYEEVEDEPESEPEHQVQVETGVTEESDYDYKNDEGEKDYSDAKDHSDKDYSYVSESPKNNENEYDEYEVENQDEGHLNDKQLNDQSLSRRKRGISYKILGAVKAGNRFTRFISKYSRLFPSKKSFQIFVRNTMHTIKYGQNPILKGGRFLTRNGVNAMALSSDIVSFSFAVMPEKKIETMTDKDYENMVSDMLEDAVFEAERKSGEELTPEAILYLEKMIIMQVNEKKKALGV